MSKLYDHPAVSYACFRPRPGPTLPSGGDGRSVDVTLDEETVIGGFLCCQLPGAPVLYVLHGADEIIADQLAYWPKWAKAMGCNLFLLDWPGYASSGGSPSFSACRRAARAGLEFLLDQNEAEIPSVVVLGRSIGSVFAIDLFADGTPERVNGLVLESGVPDVADWVAERVPWDKTGFNPEDVMAELDAALFRDFTSQKTLGDLSVPVLVMHGLVDTVVSMDAAEQFLEWSGSRRLVTLPSGDHHEVPQLNAELYQEQLGRFLAEVAPRQEV